MLTMLTTALPPILRAVCCRPFTADRNTQLQPSSSVLLRKLLFLSEVVRLKRLTGSAYGCLPK